jgi:hypothetical protein
LSSCYNSTLAALIEELMMAATPQSISLVKLTDLDKLTLKQAFEEANLAKAVSFDDSNAKGGSAGFLDPITATVICVGMACTTIAIWACQSKKTEIMVMGPNGEAKVKVSQTSECRADVLGQLTKIFPSIPT